MNYQKCLFLWGALLLVSPFPAAFIFADEASEEASSKDSPSFTLRPVDIDPLGADDDTAWIVHAEDLRIRSAPSLEHSRVLGSVSEGTEVRGVYMIVEESDEEWLEVDFLGQKGYILRIGFSRIHPNNQEMIERYGNLPYGQEIVNRWWGIPLDYEADDLVTLPGEYTREREGVDYRLRREAADSLMAMMDAMRRDGLDIFVSSPYRSGSRQQAIYTRSMERRPHQRGSAPPGHSEHQLGVTVDFSSEREARRSLRNTDRQHHWLAENAAKYGWRQTYLADNTDETGYIEEPWHWRYIGVDGMEVTAEEPRER